MPQPTIVDFVNRWQAATLTERQGSQPHFIELCDALGVSRPTEDSSGEAYAFEKGVTTTTGARGFADVWKRGCFAWEYKGKDKDLDVAYQQLLKYREDLENPPLLVVCDLARFIVHTNFNDTVKKVYDFSLQDLLKHEPTATCSLPPLDVLRAIFTDPSHLRPDQSAAEVTELAAAEFATLADSLRAKGHDPQRAAHFLMRVLFCLFAQHIRLLPAGLFSRLLELTHNHPPEFGARLAELFTAMATGTHYGSDHIAHFDGDLFTDAEVLDLSATDLKTLLRVSALDWSSIEPAIFGTLFERSLDASKRSQIGAHYTSKDDILLIIEPVLMVPLRRRWAAVKAKAEELIEMERAGKTGTRKLDHELQELPLRLGWDKAKAKARELREKAKPGIPTARKLQNSLRRLLQGFADELSRVRVLDPACGSGNFLYVSLKLLLDLWKEVSVYGASRGLPHLLPYQVKPAQLYGIEINVYAHELASVVVWIGYIQWLHDNGFGVPPPPILRRLQNIRRMDAVLTHDKDGKPVEPEWPEADVIVGNPPFLGDKKMRAQLGDEYVDDLRCLYGERVPGGADFVVYWHERAREAIESKTAKRAGLLATNSIRNGASRRVLEQMKKTGNIFMAWSDRPWVLDGANVRVSMVGFDDGTQKEKSLDGRTVDEINADLTAGADLTRAISLPENGGLCFLGMMKAGPFDIDDETAQGMLAAPQNPNGRPNSDVVKRRLAGSDVVRRPGSGWIVDFGTAMSEVDAALYERPFEYIRQHVQPIRARTRRKHTRERWWIHGEARPGLRRAIAPLARCIVTPEVSKHRVFAWMPTTTIPDQKLHVFARQDDYFFGVLHSRAHELWALNKCSTLEDRPSYNSQTTFETFPLPWPPGKEPGGDHRVKAIGAAAKMLVEERDKWLNPLGISPVELKGRTLTNLYNQRPQWLDDAHRALDKAVLVAYGWPVDIGDAEVLGRLLVLNRERAAMSGAMRQEKNEKDVD